MASSPKPGPATERDGKIAREERGVVELDVTFGRMLGLGDGQKSQHAHPLTIHLSPTSTANVIITSLTPSLSATTPFAKIAPDGEVIVAPKSRPRLANTDRTTSRSITSASRRSNGVRSVLSTRQRSHREHAGQTPAFLRPVARSVCEYLFEEDAEYVRHDKMLAIWIDQNSMRDSALKGIEWVSVSIIKPGGIEPLLAPQQQQKIKDAEASEAGWPASKIVASLRSWENAPAPRHAAISSALCSALEVDGIVGGVVRIEAAPQSSSRSEVEGLKLFPFSSSGGTSGSLRLGGHPDPNHEDMAEYIRKGYDDSTSGGRGLLDGPITDGQILPMIPNTAWEGGIVRIKGRSFEAREPIKSPRWCIGQDIKSNIRILRSLSYPNNLSQHDAENSSENSPSLVGVDNIIAQTSRNLLHCSPVLLTGGLGSGKSSLSQLLSHRMRSNHLYHTSYLCCRKLMMEDIRIVNIQDTFKRLFMAASWGVRLGGHALIVLDDLDKLCPAETELQTSDNGRSRHVSELLCSLAREHCGRGSKIILLVTAHSREAVHSLIIGANIVKEIIPLKVPNKDGRRKILQAITDSTGLAESISNGNTSRSQHNSFEATAAWTVGSPPSELTYSNENFALDNDVDLLDLAGQTDGYMPGDLILLVSRAKNEALIRTVEASADSPTRITLVTQDFQNALRGFTPASLRNVTLQSSKVTFDSIGGLHETRKILVETLQYPTKYAPIFAQCPLRLRSGLLLYGYPGCGKTLLASAIAGECGLNFISVKGPEILNKYIGASEKSVRDLFERAEAAKPCVLFFDEFDSIAPKRGHDSTGVTDRVVNQLLTQMDGAEGLSGVYVLAATSRPDLIDPALLRPGRLDKSLLCDMPGLQDRLDILVALATKLSFAQEVLSEKGGSKNLAEVARRTSGYSGADLQAVIYNAHLEAIHDALGDHSANGDVNVRKSKESKKPNRTQRQDILRFRFDKDEDTKGSFIRRGKEATEYAAIISKLDALKVSKKQERLVRRGLVNAQGNSNINGEAKKDSTQKVVIDWKHLETSLATTRSSVSADERRRLEYIYREFIVGRNGDMPDGQGPTEVGGRASLM
ncbi:MAG: hypothetical protein Q9163_002721 [Psora crenata]